MPAEEESPDVPRPIPTELHAPGAPAEHTDGTRDVALAPNVRGYFLAGTQHGGKAGMPRDAGPCINPRNWHDPMPAIRALLIALEDSGTTSDFLGYVYVNRPGRPDVRAEIAKDFPDAVAVSEKKIDRSAQTAGTPQADAPNNAIAPGLQRNVRPYLAKLDVRVWQDRLVKIERQVCRVELEGNALGTGFLVGPDTVLTNWHVFEIAKNAGKVGKLGCRFDYVRLPSGQTDAGQLVLLDAAGSLDGYPYSAAEKAGLHTKDIILEVNRHQVKDVSAYEREAQTGGGRSLLLLVQRNDVTMFIPVKPAG